MIFTKDIIIRDDLPEKCEVIVREGLGVEMTWEHLRYILSLRTLADLIDFGICDATIDMILDDTLIHITGKSKPISFRNKEDYHTWKGILEVKAKSKGYVLVEK